MFAAQRYAQPTNYAAMATNSEEMNMGLDLNDDLLTTGDPESIDAALDDMELDDSLLFGDEGDDDHQPTDTEHDEPEEKAVEDDKPEDIEEQCADDNQVEVIDTTGGDDSHGDGNHDGEDKPEESQLGVKEIDGKLYVAVDAKNSEVMGKDGKHKIPYEVLERARKGAGGSNELQKRVQELESQLKNSTQKQELFQKQLTEAGINPDKLPDELLKDPEAIERIQEEYPGDAGKIIAALISKVNGGGQQATETVQPVSSDNPVEAALATDELKELNDWRDGDKDRWEMALIIDNKLSESPDFAQLPIAQRFVEVQRRVKASFGDPVQASVEKELANQGKQPQGKAPAQQKAEPPKQAIPNSPSELGTTPQDTTQAGYEALAAQDAMAMEHSMAGMSDDALESFLEQAGMAFD